MMNATRWPCAPTSWTTAWESPSPATTVALAVCPVTSASGSTSDTGEFGKSETTPSPVWVTSAASVAAGTPSTATASATTCAASDADNSPQDHHQRQGDSSTRIYSLLHKRTFALCRTIKQWTRYDSRG